MELIKIVCTSLLSVVSLFIIAKIMGHKQISQLDFFDYIVGITIGSIAADLATELEEPLQLIIAIIIYGGASVLLSKLALKFPQTRKYINGTPTIIMNDGKIYRKNMKKSKIDLSELLMMCRQQGYFNINDIHTAVFECNGRLTILPYVNSRPVTPSDLNLKLQENSIFAEVIMDGRIMSENLKRMGVNNEWLQNEIEAQGYNSPKDIYLGICDNNKKLSLFKTI